MLETNDGWTGAAAMQALKASHRSATIHA